MSLLNKNRAFSVRDYLFMSVGLLCLFGFLLGYPSQEPRSPINMNLDENSASAKAVEAFNDLGYSSEELQSTITFQTNRKLLDSLQVQFGRQEAINMLSDPPRSGVYPFHWDVKIQSNGKESFQEGEVILRLNQEGELIEFYNPDNILPERIVNRNALIAAFDADEELDLWKSLPDSAWNNVLRFDMEEGNRDIQPPDTTATDTKTPSHTFTVENIERLANYHLQNSGWDLDNLEVTDIQIETLDSHTAAEIVIKNTEPILDQNITLDMVVLPTGALHSIEATYISTNGSRGSPGLLTFFRVAITFIFGLSVLILFYFRIRSRAIDTKPALVIGVMAGLIISARILLEELATRPLFGGDIETADILGTTMMMGFSGALTSIGFFVVFAVSDSLMRQYWPQKLYSYDYLQQGMLFNKPVGETLLRSVILTFILCGIWTISLFFMPDLYFEVERTFLHFEAAWPPVYLFLNSAWFSLLVILAIFAVAGTKVHGMYQNKVITGFVTAVGLMIMAPVFQGMNPAGLELVFFAIIGVSFTFIFLQWDLMTTLFTHFLFILMLEVSTGWVVEASPDFYIFVVFSVFLIFIIATGILFISKGTEQQSLPTYVPQYVEELAQEQRMKQELQIARDVQQSFLPVQTPQFDYLELAAICKPAYETGGDYYDFVVLDDNRVAVTIGDVSGKGIQAAFFMTFVKGVLHSLCREIDSPSKILKKTNRLFCDNAPRGTFISLVYGVIDFKKKVFRFARAGHNPILRLNSSDGTIEELQPSGIGIGLTPKDIFDKNIEEVELDLTEDDVLVLYTDGIVEALNNNNKFYGSARLNRVLRKNKDRSASDILEKISDDVRSYVADAKQHDDMTMLVMKLKEHQ